MDKSKKYCITSALPYANGGLHLGHLAGAYLPADIFVRYLRGMGCDAIYICGSDEHGAAITMRAKKEGISPQEIIDKYHQLNKVTFERLGISFDYYHRTSAELHHQTSQDFFTQLYRKGDEFEERLTEQYFDEAHQQFLADRYITGECPKCGYAEAYGDQCERCGTSLSPVELKNPKSVLSGQPPVLKPTKHWYFRLDKHAGWLRQWLSEGLLDGKQHHHPEDWKKHVAGQCLSWLDDKEGLQPRAITRDLDWGIPVPLPDAAGKVLYVWFDAPIGYISATRQWALENGKNWEDYWKGDQVQLIHFIGKDNIVFHCIIFPAMLKAYGEFALPVNVPANQFLNFEGRKFSKSRGWGVEQHEYLEQFADFPNKEDALRWTLTRIMPENRDSDFKWDEFVDYHDKDLADNFGNFINRVTVLTNAYFGGLVPSPAGDDWQAGLESVREIAALLAADVEHFDFRSAAARLMEISSWGNQYLQDAAPWALRKSDPESPQIGHCLFLSLQVVSLLSALCEPFIPFSAQKIRSMLNLPAMGHGGLESVLHAFSQGLPLMKSGHRIGEPVILFPKINDRKDDRYLKLVEAQKAILADIIAAEKATERPAVKPLIQYEDFTKMDIRTATILSAERIPKADKLLKLTVDLGLETRTVVSGIAEHYAPEEVIGRKVLLLANLAPRALRGINSEGMILMAEDGEGKLGFVSPGPDWGSGWIVK
jgi:methionyl-tRNA synthetase